MSRIIKLKYPFNVDAVEMILNKLYSRCEVGLVKLIRYIPANGAKLAPLLHCRMKKGNGVQHRFPWIQVADVELLLIQQTIRPLETSLHTLWWLSRELDGNLQQVNWKLGMHLCCEPTAEAFMNCLRR